MKNFDFKKNMLLLLSLISAYLFSGLFIKNVFLANSPKIRPNLDQYLLAKVNNTKEKLLAKFKFDITFPSFNLSPSNNLAENQTREETINFLKNNLKTITKGVSAAEENGVNYIEFRLNEVEWAEISYTLSSGKIVNIRYPKGTNPPPSFIYENQNE